MSVLGFVPLGLGSLVAIALLPGCARDTFLVASREVDADAGPDTGSIPPDAGEAVAYCGNRLCACSNGIDDDLDGFIDGFDGECTGPFDDDERSFATGEEKSGNPQCVDCFFDGNAGAGDDDCRIAASCGVEGTSAGSPGACNSCMPSSMCVDTCLPRTPNGCDCFGCCEVALEAVSAAIQLTDTCSLADVEDAEKCPRCLPSRACFNECGECELCPGKTLADLPAACRDVYTCDAAERCGEDRPCAAGGYCIQGCCTVAVF